MGNSEEERLRLVAEAQPAFARHLGMHIVSVTRDRLAAEMQVTPELGNRNGVLHGGAIMSLADNLGGTAAFVNLPEGASTTTLESKTNFLRAVSIGDTARAETVALHKGRTTMVWQTSIFRGDGKLAAVVTQTQMVLQPPAG